MGRRLSPTDCAVLRHLLAKPIDEREALTQGSRQDKKKRGPIGPRLSRDGGI